MMAKENRKKKTSKNDKNTSNKKAVSEQNKVSVKNSASIKDNVRFWQILSLVSIVLLCVSICGNALLLSPLGLLVHGWSGEEIAGNSQNQSLPYEVTYNSCGYGDPSQILSLHCLYVDLTFTNNSGEDTSFSGSCTAYAYQNGIKLEDRSGMQRNFPQVNDIQSGYSIQVRQYYELRDNSPVNLKVTDTGGNILLEQTIDLPN